MDNEIDNKKQKQSSFFFNGGLCLLWICCLLVGCDSRRDIPTDPAIAPVIVPFDLEYDDQTGTVILTWEYLGLHPPARFRFLRVEREGIRFLNWQDLPASTRLIEERADVWDMAPIMDMIPNSGEEYAYIMRTETVDGRPAEVSLGQVQIPGARIEDIILQPEKKTATIVWQVPAGMPQKLELLRQANDDSPPVVYALDNLSDTTFVDVLPKGNVAYRYVLQNTMGHGVVLESRAFILQAYPQLLSFQASEPLGTHVFLTPSMNFSSDLLALIATEDFIAVRDLGVFGYIITPRELPVKNRAQLNLNSLSLGVTPIGKPRIPLRLFVGIVAESKAVQLSAFFSESDVFKETSWQHTDWFVDDSNVPTAVFVGSDGTIWVGVEKTLRAFASDENGVIEVGQFPLGFSGDIQSLVVFDSGIWVVTTDGQVWRSSSVIDGAGNLMSPVWQQVVLPVDAYPIGVSGNEMAVFVLDKAQGRILAFDFDGQPGLWWQGLEGLNLDTGGLAVSRQGDVYVWDAQNQMVLFKNALAVLEKFPDPEN